MKQLSPDIPKRSALAIPATLPEPLHCVVYGFKADPSELRRRLDRFASTSGIPVLPRNPHLLKYLSDPLCLSLPANKPAPDILVARHPGSSIPEINGVSLFESLEEPSGLSPVVGVFLTTSPTIYNFDAKIDVGRYHHLRSSEIRESIEGLLGPDLVFENEMANLYVATLRAHEGEKITEVLIEEVNSVLDGLLRSLRVSIHPDHQWLFENEKGKLSERALRAFVGFARSNESQQLVLKASALLSKATPLQYPCLMQRALDCRSTALPTEFVTAKAYVSRSLDLMVRRQGSPKN